MNWKGSGNLTGGRTLGLGRARRLLGRGWSEQGCGRARERALEARLGQVPELGVVASVTHQDAAAKPVARLVENELTNTRARGAGGGGGGGKYKRKKSPPKKIF